MYELQVRNKHNSTFEYSVYDNDDNIILSNYFVNDGVYDKVNNSFTEREDYISLEQNYFNEEEYPNEGKTITLILYKRTNKFDFKISDKFIFSLKLDFNDYNQFYSQFKKIQKLLFETKRYESKKLAINKDRTSFSIRTFDDTTLISFNNIIMNECSKKIEDGSRDEKEVIYKIITSIGIMELNYTKSIFSFIMEDFMNLSSIRLELNNEDGEQFYYVMYCP